MDCSFQEVGSGLCEWPRVSSASVQWASKAMKETKFLFWHQKLNYEKFFILFLHFICFIFSLNYQFINPNIFTYLLPHDEQISFGWLCIASDTNIQKF